LLKKEASRGHISIKKNFCGSRRKSKLLARWRLGQMNIRQELELLNSLQCMQRYAEAQIIRPRPVIIHPPVDWEERKMKKNALFLKYLKIMFVSVMAVTAFVIAPMWLASAEYGKSLVLSFPPMLFMAASWMAGCWWAYDKDRNLFLAVTIGAVPIRIAVCLFWSILVLKIPGVDAGVYAFGCMAFWVVLRLPRLV